MRSWLLQSVLRRGQPRIVYLPSLEKATVKGVEGSTGGAQDQQNEPEPGQNSTEGKPRVFKSLAERLSHSIAEGPGTIGASTNKVLSASDVLNKERTLPRRRRTKRVVIEKRTPTKARAITQTSAGLIAQAKFREHTKAQTQVETGFAHDSSLVPETWAAEPWCA